MRIQVISGNLDEGLDLSKFKSKLSKVKGLKVGRFLSLIYQLYKQAKKKERFDLHKAVANAKKEEVKDSYELTEGLGDIISTAIFLKIIHFLYNCLMTASVSTGIDLTSAEMTAEYTAMSASTVQTLTSEVLPFIGLTSGVAVGLIGLIAVFKTVLGND